MGITNAGFAAIAGLVGGTGSITAFTYIGYGTGSTAFAVAQTALVTEHADQRAAATVTRVTTSVTNDTLQLAKTFTIDTTETITEVGVLNAAAAGIMLARTVLTSSRSVVSGDTWSVTYKIAFS